ncbi:DUF7768 domain-containing protein [Rhizobium sp. SU303]|uniref:DUF7768 domain-containing protein n=1 Tax=Rhizobium sp. SU303 TaxID=3138065 RepID=UPI001E5E11A7|nr:hypothetical protein [Rhizobium leguminosarum]UFW79980.1 hypothetical protein RlegSU303_08705 [Rhizobium leguminosarum bv. viciae]
MRLVIIESPYAGDIEANTAYARAAMWDCLERGEAPFASHLLYTQVGVLDDSDPIQRQRGIEAGLLWGKFAEATIVYTDRGISAGMHQGIDRAVAEGRLVVYRSISVPLAPPQQHGVRTSDLIQALSRLAGNRHSDGVSSLVSSEDRGAIINGCYDLMISSRQATAPQVVGSQALLDVAGERRRQVEAEGWTPEHDDQHMDASMALAAGSYCESAARPSILARKPGAAFAIPKLWPQSWSRDWWKPKSPREDLVRAAALIIAEIERLDRAAATEATE